MTNQLLNQPLETAAAESNATTVLAEQQPGETVVSTDTPAELILGKFKSHDDLAKAYTNLETMLGKKITNLTPEEAAVLKGLQGRPASAEEYKVPEGVDPEIGSWFREQAHKIGLSNNDAMELMAGYDSLLKRGAEEAARMHAKVHQANIDALKKEFGAAFEQRIALAQEGAKAVGGDELINLLGEAGLGTNPVIIKALAEVGKSLREDSIPKSQHASTFGLTPDDAKQTINQKMLDRDFREAYFDARHPAHKAAVAEMERLFTIAS